jgi:hypothetical protein
LDLSLQELSIGGRQLTNPFKLIEELLTSRLQGTRSIIHGDLNLENILIGPGDLVWLIDFAATREGHTLYDFARLEVELTTQVVAEVFHEEGRKLSDFLLLFDKLAGEDVSLEGSLHEISILLNAVRSVAKRCSYDPANAREFRKALILAYLGSLKFANLDELPSAPLPKALAFTASAYLMTLESR